MKKISEFTQSDKLNALKAALVAVIILGIAGSGFLGYSLHGANEKNALLADQMNVQTASLEAEIDTLNGTISELESSGDDKDSKIEELESTIETLEAQVETLEAKLNAKPTSQSSGSSGSSASTSSSSDTQSQTVYVTRTGSKYHRAGCQYLRQSQIAISLSNAKAQGYTACSRCF